MDVAAQIKFSPKKIPYSFAKSRGVLLLNAGPEGAHVSLRADAAPSVLAEVRRVLGVPVQATCVSVDPKTPKPHN